ncbi:MAG: amidohydrolase family protein, partial [Microbacterium sp.]
MSALHVHRAPFVLSPHRPPLADGGVAVRAGRILDVGPFDIVTKLFPGARTIEWQGVITPGLVNAHTHLQYTSMADVGQAEHDGFEAWMSAFMVGYERPNDWGASAADGAAQALRSGTTAVAEIVTDPAAAPAVGEAGLGGIVFWEVMGWTDAEWRAGGARTVEEQLRALPPAPTHGLSPHAVYSLDTGVMRELSALAARLGMRQHIHAAESAFEDAFVRTGTGQLADEWRQVERRAEFRLLAEGGCGRSVIGYLDELGALGPRTHLAHGIYVDADDRRLLRERDVAVALCPRSNAVIGLDEAPVAAYLREGNRIAVGTDSLSSSPSLNLLQDVAELHRIARRQGYADAELHLRLLHAATRGGALALGLEDTGVLSPGARADLAVFPTAAT